MILSSHFSAIASGDMFAMMLPEARVEAKLRYEIERALIDAGFRTRRCTLGYTPIPITHGSL